MAESKLLDGAWLVEQVDVITRVWSLSICIPTAWSVLGFSDVYLVIESGVDKRKLPGAWYQPC